MTRRLGGALLIALVLAGCSHAPKPVSDAAAANEDAPHRNTRTRRTAAKEPRPAPPPPVAPAPVSEPNTGVVAGSSTSAPVDTAKARNPVVPQLSSDERRELEKSSREQIEAARTRLASLDAGKLDAEKQQKLLIAQGFLADAIAARTQQDWMRAAQLATKARVLADELGAH
jgi:PBP1b-binding outer membrane lipoprotein LpoB